MKDWKSCVRTWKRKRDEADLTETKTPQEKTLDQIADEALAKADREG